MWLCEHLAYILVSLLRALDQDAYQLRRLLILVHFGELQPHGAVCPGRLVGTMHVCGKQYITLQPHFSIGCLL